jgi:predicted RNA-binding Zn-ribbon protein involved in translation (DUF1610 family)
MKKSLTIGSFTFDADVPDFCPQCGKTISPINEYITTFRESENNWLIYYVIFMCPACGHVFMASFSRKPGRDTYSVKSLYDDCKIKKIFPQSILQCSPSFVSIYNEAYAAEQMGAKTITGPGYRMALEFLIKDYSIKCYPTDKSKIVEMPIADCIKTYIKNAVTEDIIEKTVWIGNDATHYEWKHTDIDLEDLKSLIDICVAFLDADIKRRDYSARILKTLGSKT